MLFSTKYVDSFLDTEKSKKNNYQSGIRTKLTFIGNFENIFFCFYNLVIVPLEGMPLNLTSYVLSNKLTKKLRFKHQA